MFLMFDDASGTPRLIRGQQRKLYELLVAEGVNPKDAREFFHLDHEDVASREQVHSRPGPRPFRGMRRGCTSRSSDLTTH